MEGGEVSSRRRRTEGMMKTTNLSSGRLAGGLLGSSHCCRGEDEEEGKVLKDVVEGQGGRGEGKAF